MITATTRLQLRAIRYLIPVMIQVGRIKSQIKTSPGCVGLELRKTKGLAFWTKTLWKDEKSLVAFSNSGAHQAGKPKLKNWCNEAVHANWELEQASMPSWEEAERTLVKYGRLSTLDHPTTGHENGIISVR